MNSNRQAKDERIGPDTETTGRLDYCDLGSHYSGVKRRRYIQVGSLALFCGLAGCNSNGNGGTDGRTGGSDGGGSGSPTRDGDGDSPSFSNAIQLLDTYAFEITAHYQDVQVSGRQNGNNLYHDIRLGGQRVEKYFVDGTSYVVTEGLCVENPDSGSDPTTDLSLIGTDPETHESAVAGNAEVKPVRTTTLDGATVYVYEVTTDGLESIYYVEAETDLLRKVEVNAPNGDITVEFSSWGNVEPIQPPECGTATATPSEGPSFNEGVNLLDEYEFEVTAHYQDVQVSGRQNGDNLYHDVQLGGQRVEKYFVDGTSYVVTQGLCVRNPDSGSDPTTDLSLIGTDPETHESAVTGNADVKPVRTTTLNGETVYVYEVTTDGVESIYYVEAETNLVRKVEVSAPNGDITVEFSSWGNVEPIQPPSDCI